MSVPTDRAPESSRRRIVIPLDGQRARYRSAPAPPRKSRAGKITAILVTALIAIVFCVAAGTYLWWHHYKTTPAYSLALLVDAAQQNDMGTVDKIVDTDKIVDNFAGEVTEKAAGRFGAAIGSSARTQIEAAVPGLLPALKQYVRDGIAARVKETSENAAHKPFILVAVVLPYVVNITQQGDTANAAATFRDQLVELNMQRDGAGWKVVAVRDNALVQQVVDQLIKDLPALGQGDEQEIRKNLKKLPRGFLGL